MCVCLCGGTCMCVCLPQEQNKHPSSQTCVVFFSGFEFNKYLSKPRAPPSPKTSRNGSTHTQSMGLCLFLEVLGFIIQDQWSILDSFVYGVMYGSWTLLVCLWVFSGPGILCWEDYQVCWQPHLGVFLDFLFSSTDFQAYIFITHSVVSSTLCVLLGISCPLTHHNVTWEGDLSWGVVQIRLVCGHVCGWLFCRRAPLTLVALDSRQWAWAL